MKFKIITTGICFLIFLSGFAQRKGIVTKVSTTNKIYGDPYLILPRKALKMNCAIVEFTYTIGDNLKLLLAGCDTSSNEFKDILTMFERAYDADPKVIKKLLMCDRESFTSFKLDKEISHSFVSIADYDKVYKYTKLKSSLFNIGLNLEYDENGVLIKSKSSYENQTFQIITKGLATMSSLAGNLLIPKSFVGPTKDKHCFNNKYIKKLDSLINAYNNFYTGNRSGYDKLVFDKISEKYEDDIINEFEELFYKREVKIVPVEIIFNIPNNRITSIPLFKFDNINGMIILNDNYRNNYLFAPGNKFNYSTSLNSANSFQLAITNAPNFADKYMNFDSITTTPKKATVVFNIPQSAKVSLVKPGNLETIFDDLVKIPQYGTIGYLSIKISQIEVEYDNNGEIRKVAIEKKSTLSDDLSQGNDLVTDFQEKYGKPTEIDALDKKVKLLELRKKLRDLEKSED